MITLDDVNKIFHTYGHISSMTATKADCYDGRVEGIFVFHSPSSFLQLISDIGKLRDMEHDSLLRKSNPMVQKAYEEYRLLLKLST